MKSLYELIHELPDNNDFEYQVRKILDNADKEYELRRLNDYMGKHVLYDIEPKIIEYECEKADYWRSGYKTYQIGECIIKIEFNGDREYLKYYAYNKTPDDIMKKKN